MAEPQLVTIRDFTTSRYAQIAENTEGNLSDILARSEQAIQKRIGRQLLEQEYIETFRAESQTFFLSNRPVTSIVSVRRKWGPFSDWVTLSLPLVTVESGPGYIECVDFITNCHVEVTYTAGYEELPEDIREAILMQAVMFTYQDLEVYGAGDSRAPGVLYFYQDIDRLLMPYKSNPTVYH